MTNITIQNPNNLPLIDYRKCKPLQGDLKDLSETNYKKLKGVLEKRGFDVPLFLWKSGEDYFLMDGHQRQRVMTREDMQPYEVPYILIDAKDEKEAKSKLLEITSQYGTITQEGFDAFIAQLDEAEVLEAVHFDALSFGGKDESQVEEDEPPEVDDKEPPKSKLGEVYQLGRHRVMCGDSTDKASVELLMNGEKADMVFTDPPYGVSYEGRKKFGIIDNDELDKVGLLDFLRLAFGNVSDVLKEGGCFYICSGWPTIKEFITATEDKRLILSTKLVWIKNNLGWGFADYRTKTEVILYGFKEGGKHYWCGDRDQSNVWEFSKDTDYKHPTQKPIELVAKAINNSSKNGESIVDLFLGSGSTLIACEQTDRTCYGMELDPKYVDVIRKRYWKFTNDGNEDGWEEGTPVIGKETVVENAVS